MVSFSIDWDLSYPTLSCILFTAWCFPFFIFSVVIPLAKKLKKCGVFGVSSDEFLNYATQNRREWETRGQQIVEEMVATLEKQPIQKQVISETESSAVEIGSAEFEV